MMKTKMQSFPAKRVGDREGEGKLLSVETVLFMTLSNSSPSELREPPPQEAERVGKGGWRTAGERGPQKQLSRAHVNAQRLRQQAHEGSFYSLLL